MCHSQNPPIQQYPVLSLRALIMITFTIVPEVLLLDSPQSFPMQRIIPVKMTY